jgi:hypothetical protein
MTRIFSAAILVTILCGGLVLGMAAQGTDSESEPCCFSNPRYSGVCQVTPGADETCAGILSYLNNQNSVGKAYCGNTTIRGGWASVTCDEKEAKDTRNALRIPVVEP